MADERETANDDHLDYVVVECDFSFDQLLDAMRESGAEVTNYLIPDDGTAIQIAND